MNEKMNPKDAAPVGVANLLQASAEQVNPNPAFIAELEDKLKAAHKPQPRWTMPASRSLFTVVGWAGALAVLALLMNWAIRTLAVNPPQPSAGGTSFACPVTAPNGSLPPGETVESPDYLGNDALWTVLWPDGRVYVTPENREPGGGYGMKWGWWRAINGALTIEGRRLDAESDPLRAEIPDGYGDTGFQVSGLIFPEPGCWEVTGRVGDVSLTFVTEVIFVDVLPTPDAITTPVSVRPVGQAYEWNGIQLYLTAPLPDLPNDAPLYLYQPDPHITLETARALAAQLGMNGQAYLTPPEVPDSADNDFLIVDGNQRLYVRSNQYFIFYPDYTRSTGAYNPVDYPGAESIIADFLASKGFGAQFRVEPTDMVGAYVAISLTSEGLTIRNDNFGAASLNFRFDKDGLYSVDANLVNYAPADDKRYRIITAEEAFQRLLDPSASGGFLAGQSSPSQPLKSWIRPRRENETVTVWGWLNTYASAEGGRPLASLDGYTIESPIYDWVPGLPNHFVEVTGQFRTLNGVKIFYLESINDA
ncbi:MAG: hypothetical protein AB1750_20295, partial [Chloroflexota bacterium]